jgi:serpin B
VEKGLEGILAEVGRGKSGMVNLVLPRFRLEESVALKPLLVGLGMRRAFGDEADFTGISPRAGRDGLYVSEVLHKAFVEVNEEGAEAAAATGVVMATRSAMRPEEPEEFRADHPFVFLIRDRMTGTTLFLGRFMGK